MKGWFAIATLLAVTGCHRGTPPLPYDTVPVERRTIQVSATAAGTVEPVLTVDVKSKASGEIIQMNVETGDEVKAQQLLAVIDPRQPRNNLAQAQANLDVAKAQLDNARTALARADTFYTRQVITEVEHDDARLAYANAKAQAVRAQADLDNAQDQMDDTRVLAPIAGTIITKNVELGTVISSPTKDVGGGTVLLSMANLDTVQVRALVDETDVGKISPGLTADITVDAYPDRKFEGTVLKIEPMATVQQNVTMFPVLVRIGNPGHLLKPGMNAEVEVLVGRRENVLTIPYSALRTTRDVASAAAVLGLDPDQVNQELQAGGNGGAPGTGSASAGVDSAGRGAPRGKPATKDSTAAEGAIMTLPGGRTVTLPPGVSVDEVRAAMRKRMEGGELSPQERSLLHKVFAGMGGPGGGGRNGNGGNGTRSTSRYIVFVERDGRPVPVEIRTGLTDLDYIEVMSGLKEGDEVILLPSASLVASQQQFKDRLQRFTGGGIPGMRQQSSSSSGQRSQGSR
jgi:HlyD family secretion protein